MSHGICIKCQVEKPSGEFHYDSSKRNGLQSWCKNCKREADKQYRAEGKRSAVYRRYRANNKPAIKSRRYVSSQVKFGRLPHPTELRCVYCGEQAREYHHYLGYAKKFRYSVFPTCAGCHPRLAYVEELNEMAASS